MPDSHWFERMLPVARRAAWVLGPALAVIVLYYPAIHLGMVWDDHLTFQQIPYYTNPAFLFDAIRNPLIYFANYYRPLVVISFLLQTYVFGVDPRVFHLTSILIAAVNTGLVAWLAFLLAPKLAPRSNRAVLTVLAGLFYGLHPVLIEPTTYLSSRFDLLLTFFLLLAFLADVSVRNPWWRASAVGAAFLLAALCKEMALGFPLALPLWHLAREPRPLLPLRAYWRSLRQRGDLHVYVGVVVAGLIYLLLRDRAIGYILHSKAIPLPPLAPVAHLLLVAYTITQYLSLIVLPFGHLSPAHPLPFPFEVSAVGLWLRLAGVVVLVAALVYLMHRRVRGAYLFAGALLSLFPISNVLPLPRPLGAFFAESYLVFPMALFALAAIFLFAEGYERLSAINTKLISRGGIAIIAIWFAASLVTIRQTIPLWNSDLSLWTWAAKEDPDSPTALSNLAAVQIWHNLYAQAAANSKLVLRMPASSPNARSTAWYVLAAQAFRTHHVNEAIRLITRASQHTPLFSEIPVIRAAYLNYGAQYSKAAAQARACLAKMPYESFAHTQLGIALIGLGNYKEAASELRIARDLEKDPVRKRIAERNLKLAEEGLKLGKSGLLPLPVKPSP